MNTYINQLIEDLAQAAACPAPELDFGNSNEDFDKVMHQIEQWEKMPAKDMLNVSYEELPPVEMMDKMLIQKLLLAIFNALAAKGTQVHVPGNGVPVEIVYAEIREMFKDGFHVMPGWTIDFCSGWCPECAFADYCQTCMESWTKEDMEKERNKIDNRN
jgi:hypothetical protein